MNPCERTDSLLTFFIDDETSPAERRFVEGHLTACPRCRRQREELEHMLDRVRGLPRIQVSAGFTDRVVAEAMGRPAAGLEEPVVALRPGLLARWAPPVAAAAALGLVAFLAVSRLASPGGQSEPVAALDTPATTETAPSAVDVADGEPLFHVFGETDPGLQVEGAVPPTSLGARYVLEDWMLTQPTGGGRPVLTRVGATPDHRVTVSF